MSLPTNDDSSAGASKEELKAWLYKTPPAESYEALLSFVPEGDQDKERWLKSLENFQLSFDDAILSNTFTFGDAE